MAATYPNRGVFDVWTKLGNKGWDRHTMEPYFRKFQHLHTPSTKTVSDHGMDYMDIDLYGREGPVSTSFPEWYLPVSTIWVKTMERLGLKAKRDPITGDAIGAFTNPSFIDPTTGTRSHAGVAYWEPASP